MCISADDICCGVKWDSGFGFLQRPSTMKSSLLRGSGVLGNYQQNNYKIGVNLALQGKTNQNNTTSHTTKNTQIHSKNKVENNIGPKWPREKFFPCSCTMVSNPDPLVPPAKLPAELATSRSKRATWSDRCERSKAWQPRHKTCLVHIPESRPCPLLELLPWAPSLHPQTTLNVQLSDIKVIHSRHFTPATAEILKLIDSKDPS